MPDTTTAMTNPDAGAGARFERLYAEARDPLVRYLARRAEPDSVEGDFQVMAMATDHGDTKVGMMAGSTPAGATRVKVEGGAAGGATATVTDVRFALWAPRALDTETTIVALDASGAEIGSVEPSGAPPDGPPVMIELDQAP